jgi:hypothetical protein
MVSTDSPDQQNHEPSVRERDDHVLLFAVDYGDSRNALSSAPSPARLAGIGKIEARCWRPRKVAAMEANSHSAPRTIYPVPLRRTWA